MNDTELHPYKIVDNDYGLLSFSEYGDVKYFGGKFLLSIALTKIDVFFDTTSKDRLPTIKQKEFLNNIVENYDAILARLFSVLPPVLPQKDYKGLYKIKAALEVVSLKIPDIDNEYNKWDMTFRIKSINNTFLIVYFENLQPFYSTVEKDQTKTWLKFLIHLMKWKF